MSPSAEYTVTFRTFAGGEPVDKTVVLDGDEMVVGRHPRCHVLLKAPSVGSFRAILYRTAVGYEIERYPGGPPIYVNREQVVGRRALSDGNQIQIADAILTYRVSD